MHQAHAHLLDPAFLCYRLDHLPCDTNLFPCTIAVHLYVGKKPALIQSKRRVLDPKVCSTCNLSKGTLNDNMRRCTAIKI